MINIILPKKVENQLELELEKAGKGEIGGILMGEHLRDNTFKIHDVTIDIQQGSWNSFIRIISSRVRTTLQKFFQTTNHQYKTYNYLGEWHSHPSFVLKPSNKDIQSMWEIINDENLGANFSVLMIVKLESQIVEGKVYLFVPGKEISEGKLLKEGEFN